MTRGVAKIRLRGMFPKINRRNPNPPLADTLDFFLVRNARPIAMKYV